MRAVELFTTAYNEEYLLPGMINFYKERIPGIIINIYDNESTDRTAEIALDMGCRVKPWYTGGQVRDDLLLDFKNNIWKGTNAPLVIVCDVDEWVDFRINPQGSLDARHKDSYFRSEGYNMVSEKMGVRYTMEDKVCVFPPNIKEVNYGPGAHTARPFGYESSYHPKLYHMKYTMPIDMVVERYRVNAERLSKYNKDNGLGFHYTFDEATIRKEYAEHLLTAQLVQ